MFYYMCDDDERKKKNGPKGKGKGKFSWKIQAPSHHFPISAISKREFAGKLMGRKSIVNCSGHLRLPTTTRVRLL